jgi:neurotransmitter:Na+ symporter, NSS family
MALKEPGKRDGFTSKFGILAAAAGSAIGLGNIWRFPYVVGENGGGAFLLVYFGFVLVLGIPVMMSEFIIGRKAGLNAYGSFKKLAPGTWWPVVGVMGIVAAFVILAFYSTIAGWTLHYVYSSFANAFKGMSPDDLSVMFQEFQVSGLLPVFWQMVFLILTAIIILSGVKKGIEKYSKILMPFLLFLLIVLCIRSITLPGAMEGITFLFRPDFSKINANVLLSALGQAAFSLSIGMGALITYASYFPKNTNLSNTAVEVSIADVLIAILAGVAIFPAVFAFNMEPGQGVGLIFMVLPNVFLQMPGGFLLSIAFFVLLAIAALTSAISIMEVVVAYLVEEFNLHRRHATIITLLASAFVGVFCTLSWSTFENVQLAGLSIFDVLDYAASNVLLPLGGLLIVVFVGWYMDNQKVKEEVTNQGVVKFRLFNAFIFIIKFIAPVAIAIIFLRGIGLI